MHYPGLEVAVSSSLCSDSGPPVSMRLQPSPPAGHISNGDSACLTPGPGPVTPRPAPDSKATVPSSRGTCRPSKMGNEASYPLEMCSHFDADEIKRLGKRFKKLDLDNSGSLSLEEFMSLTELQQNPLVQRVIDIFNTDGNGEADFKELIEGFSQFSVKGDKEQKLRFAFRIYDMDKDGYISNGELFQVLKMMVGNNLKDRHNRL